VVERILGKDEVTGSNPVVSSMDKKYDNKNFKGLRRQENVKGKI
jgi:hypothetical protein